MNKKTIARVINERHANKGSRPVKSLWFSYIIRLQDREEEKKGEKYERVLVIDYEKQRVKREKGICSHKKTKKKK